MSTPAVDVIVVNWNNREETLACLAAVAPQLAEIAGGALVTVVDNGSTDGSIHAVRAAHPAARLLPLGTNTGFTGGVAAGVSRSPARNVVFLNNDAIPEPGWLAALVRALDDAPADVVSVGGKIVDLEGQRIDFIGGMMTFDGHAFQDGFRYPLGSRPEPDRGAELLFACGGNMISRREALVELGGFDDDYFAYLEDVDFGWRTWIAGRRVTYEPQATVRHHSSATSNRLGDFERGVLFERNALQTVLKNYDDDLLHDAAGSVLFTYLHRLHHYATTRNSGSAELQREPFRGHPSPTGASAKRTLAARVKRKLRGPKPLATIDDPLTAMQFRAFDWIVKHSADIAAKREAVQRLRRRTDAEIFARFPLHVVPTYPGDAELMRNPLFRALSPRIRTVHKNLGDIIRT